MKVQTITYDVFLSYSLTEAQPAALVERALSTAGLDVFSPARVEQGEDFADLLWRALAESAALVAIVDPHHAPNANATVEIGAAMAWQKPVFVVQMGNGSSPVPDYVKQFPVFPISRLEDVVAAVRSGLKPLSDQDRSALRAAYVSLGEPVDRLLQEPARVDLLAREFRSHSGRSVPGERLVHELVRLRKADALPSLRKQERLRT